MPLSSSISIATTYRHQDLFGVGILEAPLVGPSNGTPDGGQDDHILGRLLEDFFGSSGQHDAVISGGIESRTEGSVGNAAVGLK